MSHWRTDSNYSVLSKLLSKKEQKLCYFLEAFMEDYLTELGIRLPNTILHGDLFANNILQDAKDAHRISVIDWQTCIKGPGYVDVAFLLYGSTDIDELKKKEKYYVKFYYQALIRYGCPIGMDFDKFFQQYELCLPLSIVRNLGGAEQLSKVILPPPGMKRSDMHYYELKWLSVLYQIKRAAEVLPQIKWMLSYKKLSIFQLNGNNHKIKIYFDNNQRNLADPKVCYCSAPHNITVREKW